MFLGMNDTDVWKSRAILLAVDMPYWIFASCDLRKCGRCWACVCICEFSIHTECLLV
ncbi:hypothetical protein BDP55DRAFT_647505 [Colletotrichum godetiae]|uniref:Uncharacterized protein n=1 Tax=Colletotrichum godetiae TaxID=1209918 RepID=A0AAJ0AWE4_9PEZI|nr:uncharacterized protein BDP55DRAFT_647505 [Colletotrichum godetiae]KAK1691597.1 hypothetical protein BDP55DRAFT_647505 [Colletotrichum godetiae]